MLIISSGKETERMAYYSEKRMISFYQGLCKNNLRKVWTGRKESSSVKHEIIN